MTPAGVQKNTPAPLCTGVRGVASDARAPQGQIPERARASLATTATASGGAGVPLSKRERRGREGAIKQPPSPPSLSTLPLPQTETTIRRQLAAYAGAISRWCDLTGHVPDISLGQDKTAVEFDAFNQHLDDLAAEARRVKDLRF